MHSYSSFLHSFSAVRILTKHPSLYKKPTYSSEETDKDIRDMSWFIFYYDKIAMSS